MSLDFPQKPLANVMSFVPLVKLYHPEIRELQEEIIIIMEVDFSTWLKRMWSP